MRQFAALITAGFLGVFLAACGGDEAKKEGNQAVENTQVTHEQSAQHHVQQPEQHVQQPEQQPVVLPEHESQATTDPEAPLEPAVPSDLVQP